MLERPRGLNRVGWPLRTSCAPQTSVSATLLRQTEWRCPGLGPANSCAITEPSKLGTTSERALLTHHVLPNPAGFEPRMPHVSNSGLVCRCVAFPHITCELEYKEGLI